jgi:hypothetical protein
MFTLKLLKGVTLDRRNASKRWKARNEEGGKQDSDLPDDVAFEIARTDGEKAYALAKSPEATVIVQSEKYPNVGFVRGTDSLSDWKSDILGAVGKVDANMKKYIDEVKQFLLDHPSVDTLIGHSLGYGIILRAVEDNPDIEILGLDGAAVLGEDPVLSVKSRNINTDSKFDTTLDPFGPIEMSHSFFKYFTGGQAPSDRVGHQAHNATYKKKFRGDPSREKEKSTGYYHGKVMYPEDYIGKVQHA